MEITKGKWIGQLCNIRKASVEDKVIATRHYEGEEEEGRGGEGGGEREGEGEGGEGE
ncbi:hypothetical protein DEO72_LG10g1417 [Vigna unguiculata]|uniref:Uncharacterized protein n=1 Tax=Vigna unguiculata TaxID=3917 RepID=A0A4D6NBE5_VIGUN|nr:hypothetical protein DEO72_LG10g1417 [Vigna unguiculata]